jgi:hypothetical protein
VDEGPAAVPPSIHAFAFDTPNSTSHPAPMTGDATTGGRPREVFADRVHRYEAPPWVMFRALTVARWWLQLKPGEIEPQVLESVPYERVIWSSFWPVSPDDTIEFSLTPEKEGRSTAIRFRWFTDSPPDERGINITRQRLNLKFGGDIRGLVHHYSRNALEWTPPDDV